MVIIFALAAMALAWLALFGDKPRGKARCPKCWYELGALDSPPTLPVTCPECGKRVERPRQLSRRRFGRGRLLMALLLGVGIWFGSQLPGVSRRGWLWLVPNRVLYETLPLVGYSSSLGQELQRRIGIAPWKNSQTFCTLEEEDFATLLMQAIQGNTSTKPLSKEWRATYGQVIGDVLKSRSTLWRFIMDSSRGSHSPFRPLSPRLYQALKELEKLPPELDVRIGTPDEIRVGTLAVATCAVWWPCNSASVRVAFKQEMPYGWRQPGLSVLSGPGGMMGNIIVRGQLGEQAGPINVRVIATLTALPFDADGPPIELTKELSDRIDLSPPP